MSKNFDLKLPPVTIGDLVLTLGLGGLHSVDKPGIFKAENDYVIVRCGCNFVLSCCNY